MGSRELKRYCALDEATVELLKFTMTDLNLSARAYDRVLKVARTIADLAGAEASAATISPKRFNIVRWIGSCGLDYRIEGCPSGFKVVGSILKWPATRSRIDEPD